MQATMTMSAVNKERKWKIQRKWGWPEGGGEGGENLTAKYNCQSYNWSTATRNNTINHMKITAWGFFFFFLNYSSGGNYSQYSTNAKPFKRCHFLSLNAASKAYHIKVYNITTKSYRGEYKGRIIKHREQSSKKRK